MPIRPGQKNEKRFSLFRLWRRETIAGLHAGFSAPLHCRSGLGGQARSILGGIHDLSTLKNRLLKKKAKFFKLKITAALVR
jgi:hypothetical protein